MILGRIHLLNGWHSVGTNGWWLWHTWWKMRMTHERRLVWWKTLRGMAMSKVWLRIWKRLWSSTKYTMMVRNMRTRERRLTRRRTLK